MRSCAGSSLVWLLTITSIACGTEATQSVGPSPVRCEVTVTSSPVSIGAQGGTTIVDVSAERDCGWSVRTDASWLIDVAPRSGQGSGRVELRAAPNDGPSRTATVTIETAAVTVVQATGCSYAINPTSQFLAAVGGTGATTVTTGSACPWTAAANVGWITVVDGASGTGNGTASFRVDGHTGPQRTGTLTIADHIFTVAQEMGCSYSISPESALVGTSGGEGTIAVTAPAGCPWRAESLDAWILIVAGATGTGSGDVRYRAEPFPGPLSGGRVGTLIVAGHQFQLTQHRFAVPR